MEWQLKSLILATDITRQQEFLARIKVSFLGKVRTELNLLISFICSERTWVHSRETPLKS